MRPVATRRATIALLLAYEGIVALWVYYGFRHPGNGGAIGAIAWAAATVAGVALGAYGRSWWLLLAPIAAPLFAIPAGDYPDSELPVWYVVPVAIPALAFWIAVGVVVVKLLRRRSARHRRAS